MPEWTSPDVPFGPSHSARSITDPSVGNAIQPKIPRRTKKNSGDHFVWPDPFYGIDVRLI